MKPLPANSPMLAMAETMDKSFLNNPSAYLVAVTAVQLHQEQPAENLETCVQLANLLVSVNERNDEPRFSAYDYADAVCNHDKAPNFSVLLEKYSEDEQTWDDLIIALAADKRQTYTDMDHSQTGPMVESNLRAMGLLA